MRRLRHVGSFAAFSALSQAATLLAGLLVVRSLDKDQYALYSVCLASLGIVTVLSTSGVTSTLLALAGRAMQAGRDISPYFRAAFGVRLHVLLIVTLPVAIYTIFVLVGNGATVSDTVILLSLLIATVIPTITASFSRLPLQLHKDLRTVNRVSTSVAILRLSLTALALLVPAPSGAAFLAIAAVAAVVDALWTSRAARKHLQWNTSRVQEGRTDLFAAVRRTMPGNLAVILGEMLVTAALTWAGNTAGIADIAALSRFALAFVVVNAIVTNIVSPTIARMEATSRSVLRGLMRVTAAYGLIALLYVAATWLASDLLLWILGPDYSHLRIELLIIASGTALTNFSIYGLGAITYARGWNRLSWTYIPLVALWAALALSLCDLNSPLGAVILSSSLSLVRLLNQLIRLVAGFRSLHHGDRPA